MFIIVVVVVIDSCFITIFNVKSKDKLQECAIEFEQLPVQSRKSFTFNYGLSDNVLCQ